MKILEPTKEKNMRFIGFFILMLFFLFPSCVVYEPVPAEYYTASPFEVAWENAIAAAKDTGIQITSADRSTGTIIGLKSQTEITIYIQPQPDGRVKTKASFRGPEQERYIGKEFDQAYRNRAGPR